MWGSELFPALLMELQSVCSKCLRFFNLPVLTVESSLPSARCESFAIIPLSCVRTRFGTPCWHQKTLKMSTSSAKVNSSQSTYAPHLPAMGKRSILNKSRRHTKIAYLLNMEPQAPCFLSSFWCSFFLSSSTGAERQDMS